VFVAQTGILRSSYPPSGIPVSNQNLAKQCHRYGQIWNRPRLGKLFVLFSPRTKQSRGVETGPWPMRWFRRTCPAKICQTRHTLQRCLIHREPSSHHAPSLGFQASAMQDASLVVCIKIHQVSSLTHQELHTVEQSLFTYTHFLRFSASALHSFISTQDTYNEDHFHFIPRGPSAQRIRRPSPWQCEQRYRHSPSQPRSRSERRCSGSFRRQPAVHF
jgi:hypothetical protein